MDMDQFESLSTKMSVADKSTNDDQQNPVSDDGYSPGPSDVEEGDSDSDLDVERRQLQTSDLEDLFRALPMAKKTRLTTADSVKNIARTSSGRLQHKKTRTRVTESRLPLPPRSKSVMSRSSVKRVENSENTPTSSKSTHSRLSRLSKSVDSPRPLNSFTPPSRENTPKQKSPHTPLSASREMSRSREGLLTSLQVHTRGSPDSAPQDQTVDNADTGSVMTALKDVTSLLNTLIKRVEDNSKDIQSIKLSMSESSSSSSSDTSKKRKVLPVIRVSYYMCYCTY